MIELPRPNPPAASSGKVTDRWRDLAEQRLQHMIELYESGRWQRYYTEAQFLRLVRELVAAIDTWKQIAPSAVPVQSAADLLRSLTHPQPTLAPIWQGEDGPVESGSLVPNVVQEHKPAAEQPPLKP